MRISRHFLQAASIAALLTLSAAQPVATGAQITRAHIYNEDANPRADIAAALKQARREHKRVLVDFGGDWCGDCQVLHLYLHQSPNRELLEKNYIVVPVAIGHMDKNLDIPTGYGVDIKHGVPAVAVLDDHGKVVFSQKNKEVERMIQTQNSSAVTDFLNRWKA